MAGRKCTSCDESKVRGNEAGGAAGAWKPHTHLLADGVHQLAERHGHLPLEIHFTAVFRHHCEIDQLFLLWLQIRRGEGVRRRGGADHAARHLSLSLGTQLKIPNSRFHQLPRQRNIVAPRVGDIKGRGALHADTTHEVERLRVQNQAAGDASKAQLECGKQSMPEYTTSKSGNPSYLVIFGCDAQTTFGCDVPKPLLSDVMSQNHYFRM